MDEYQKECAEIFLRLFDGNQGHHLEVEPKLGVNGQVARKASGKTEVVARTVAGPVTPQMAHDHLEAKTSFGIAPNKSDDTCRYGVLDFDMYDMPDEDVFKTMKHMRCPCVAFRTKSMGLHIVVFTDKPVASRLMHDFLAMKRGNMPKAWRSKIEVLPMATQLVLRENDKAKCVNLPMRGQQRAPVYFVTHNSFELVYDQEDTREFLKYIDANCRLSADLMRDMVDAGPVLDRSDIGYRIPDDPAGRNDLLMRIARSMQARGWSDGDIRDEINRLNKEGARFHDVFAEEGPSPQGEVDALIKTTLRLEKGAPMQMNFRYVDKFNETWTFLSIDGQTEFLNKDEGVCYSKRHFQDMTAPLKVRVGKTMVPMSKLWIEDIDRDQKIGIVIEGPDYAGNGFNVFDGWAVAPKDGDASLWVDYVENTLCNGDKNLARWVMTYLADAVQRPWSIHPGSALALRGDPGGGKSFLGRAMRKIVGVRHAQTIDDSARMFDRFNRNLFGSTFVLAEEALFAGSRKQAATMKSFITGDVWTYEQKYLASFTGKNVHRVIATTNEEQAVHIDNNDRRWTVIEVPSPFAHDPHGLDAVSFWAPYYDLVDNNAGVILKYLLDYEVDRDLIRFGWSTEAKKQDKVASDPLLDLLDDIARTAIIPDDLRGLGAISTTTLGKEVQKRGGRSSQRTYANELRRKFGGVSVKNCTHVERVQMMATSDGSMFPQPVKDDWRPGVKLPELPVFRKIVSRLTGEDYGNGDTWIACPLQGSYDAETTRGPWDDLEF